MHNGRCSFVMLGITALALVALLLPASAQAQGSGRPVGVGGKAA